MRSMNCPNCGLVNPETSQRCDCGYNFAARTVNETYLNCSTRRRWIRRARWVAGALIFLAMCVYLLPFNPRRPANVPADAVFHAWAKGGAWERCWYSAQENADHCEIYNWGGGVIDNGVFVPWDGGPPIKQEQLKIQKDVQSGLGGRAICLKNGRTLIPKWLADARKEGSFRDMDSQDPACPKISDPR